MSSEPKDTKLQIHYIKNNDFKTVYATGIYGGVTINSKINIDFYTDRSTIPRKTVSYIDDNNTLQEIPEEKESKMGTVREVHFGIIMDKEVAKATIDWLQNKINIIEESEKSIKK